MRTRIAGEVVELDSPPPLDLRRKHTIEVVVGGKVVAVGMPEQIAAHPVSHTGRFLAPVLGR